MDEQDNCLAQGSNQEFRDLVPELPGWIDPNHPDFPQYFQIVVLDEKGEPTNWWHRLPTALNRKFP